jgi:methionyl-tRNA formyltransferase
MSAIHRRVVVIGKNRLAVACLDAIVRAGDDVVLAIADPGDDGTDGWQPSFLAAARRHGLPSAAPPNVNDAAFVEVVRGLAPDFLVSLQAAQILREPLIGSARTAAVNLHLAPLPRYRGVAPIAWAIINGERETGVTLHHIDPGIDSGDIIASTPVAIADDDTGRTVYEKCTDAGIELFERTWPSMRATASVPRTPQDPSVALYYNRHSIDFRARRMRWSTDAHRLADWVRAFIFPPFQYPTITLDDVDFEVTGVTWDREPHRGRPGQILEVSGDRVIVAAPGGRLTLGPLRRGDQDLAADVLGAEGFAPGVVLAQD